MEKPIEPAIALVTALNAYVAAQLDGRPEALGRQVALRGAADAEPRDGGRRPGSSATC